MICDKLKINTNELIHVGDHDKFNLNIPSKVGIISYLVDREKKINGKYIVHNLKEFEEKIKKIKRKATPLWKGRI